MNIKALSIKPPWSDHIVHGQKRIENRYWRTKYRGIIAIHSSTDYDLTAPPLPGRWLEIGCRKHKGHIIGVARLVGCITPEDALRLFPDQKPWINTDPGTWCWVLENPQPLISPVKHRGYPWIFGVEIPDDLLPDRFLIHLYTDKIIDHFFWGSVLINTQWGIEDRRNNLKILARADSKEEALIIAMHRENKTDLSFLREKKS